MNEKRNDVVGAMTDKVFLFLDTPRNRWGLDLGWSYSSCIVYVHVIHSDTHNDPFHNSLYFNLSSHFYFYFYSYIHFHHNHYVCDTLSLLFFFNSPDRHDRWYHNWCYRGLYHTAPPFHLFCSLSCTKTS